MLIASEKKYAQSSDKLSRLKKVHKKLKKVSSCKGKHYESNSMTQTYTEVLGPVVHSQ